MVIVLLNAVFHLIVESMRQPKWVSEIHNGMCMRQPKWVSEIHSGMCINCAAQM